MGDSDSIVADYPRLARTDEQVLITQAIRALDRVSQNRHWYVHADDAPGFDALAQNLRSFIGVEKPVGWKCHVRGRLLPIGRVAGEVHVVGISISHMQHSRGLI